MASNNQEEIHVLSLHLGQKGESTLYRLALESTLQFRLDPSLFGRKVRLWINVPPRQGEAFQRKAYKECEWSNVNSDDTASYVSLLLHTPGAFHFYFTLDGSEEINGDGYLVVDPELRAGSQGKLIPLDCLQCQTVLSKNLGELSSWEGKLKVSKESGYNLIHFTPVQVLGGSRSAYSLSDQHALNPDFGSNWSELTEFIQKMDKDWGLLSLCDIVLNHTANESEWVREDESATFNLESCPHLTPAYLFDRIIFRISVDIEKGKWTEKGIPKGIVNEENHLNCIRSLFYEYYYPQINLHEFFLADVDSILEKFRAWKGKEEVAPVPSNSEELELRRPDLVWKRKSAEIDLALAAQLYSGEGGEIALREKLQELNVKKTEEIWNHIHSGIDNVIKGARYHRVEPHGPRVFECSAKEPLVCQYFTSSLGDDLSSEELFLEDSNERKLMMCHNGWVMNYDPVRDVDFVDPSSNILLRRELIAWGDSVKLRYGSCPEDSPFLWEYMTKYVEQMAEIFHGLRLDNCHSTPIHVAEYLLDKARKVRPNLYVIAELFTSSEASDNVFINRLGINSLIRENLQAGDSHELGRLIYRFGGEPVGAFTQLKLRPLVPSMAHAMLFEQTHDNPSPIEKRSVYDSLSSAGLIAMACCATGANRGVDELVPHHIHVVNETRTYDSRLDTGMIQIKRLLNELHCSLGQDGYNECYVDQMDSDVVAVTRHNKITHESLVMVAHTAFGSNPPLEPKPHLRCVEVEGILGEVVLEAGIRHNGDSREFKRDPDVINGLINFSVDHRSNIQPSDSRFAESWSQDGNTFVRLKDFLPGSIICLKFKFSEAHSSATTHLRGLVASLKDSEEFQEILKPLDLSDMNHILFRCDQEERDFNGGKGGVYVLDGYGPLKYAGLQGLMSILSKIRPSNDLGNWLPTNLRSGNWLMDFISDRLVNYSRTESLGLWYRSAFDHLKIIPRFLIPKYFDAILTSTYMLILEKTWSLMSSFVSSSQSGFVRSLALGSVIHAGIIPSVSIPGVEGVSLAAGLPHFSTGYMRAWGRDTFISLRGLMIIPGRLQEAKNIILGFGACLRHGLIPNLLDGGYNARFNCRDAVWFWLQSIKDVVEFEGPGIIKEKLKRLYPKDDSLPNNSNDWETCSLEELMQEALQTHFQGLKFRERNAGKRIDEHMQNEGFNNEIGVQRETGFVFGGNSFNCGTWMDKMGSSHKAGIKGLPATPRDGSAVEIVGLSYSVISWLSLMHESGYFKYGGVKCTNSGVYWSYGQWSELLASSFEKHFFISDENSPKELRPDLINKKQIYKDTLGSRTPWADYQLRPNFCIAMAVAPELFDVEHALAALEVVKNKLLGPLGLATLDPDDWKYRGDYDNSNDSNDPTVAQGINYHQGPEWVWPVGYFLRAYLHFHSKSGKKKEAVSFIKSTLAAHYSEVISSHWRGIPELTNSKGEFCRDSNPIQAWSMSCLLEVLYDLKQ